MTLHACALHGLRDPKFFSRYLAALLLCSMCLVSQENGARAKKPSPSQQLSQLLDELYASGVNVVPRPGPSVEDRKAAQRLIDAGAGVNTRGKQSRVTVLMLAASFGDIDFVRSLISKGARVNHDSVAGNALRCAILSASPQCVELLLEHGASTTTWHYTNPRMTPLMLAAYLVDEGKRTAEKYDAVIKALLRHGADVRVVSKEGYTALHMHLATHPRLTAVRLLLEAGADVNQAASGGITPLAQCEANGATEVAELLKQWGARR